MYFNPFLPVLTEFNEHNNLDSLFLTLFLVKYIVCIYAALCVRQVIKSSVFDGFLKF